MGELIKTNLFAYVFVAAFTGFWLFSIIYEIFKKTKDIENKKKKIVLRFGVNGILFCFWIWFFIYVNVFPISLAYYEYHHNSVDEEIGIVESIERNGKDRVNIIIDNTEYIMVYSSVNPAANIGREIDEGDTVKIIFGVKSKYIFDIYESNTSP